MFQLNKDVHKNILKKIDCFLEKDSLNKYYEYSGLEFDLPSYSETEIKDFYWHLVPGSTYDSKKSLEEQYSCEEYDYEYFSELDVLEITLTILSKSSYNNEKKKEFLEELFRYFNKIGIIVNITRHCYIKILNNKILDEGSYSNIRFFSVGVLLKEMKKQYLNTPFENRIKYEFENMKKLEFSENILNVYDYLEEYKSYTMEQADECLYDYLMTNNLTLEEKIRIIKYILNGMKDAHDNSIIHRDLHLGNILRKNDRFVIADFGLAKDLSRDRSLKSSNTQKSNSKFVDPECRGDKFLHLDKVSDIYSIGVIIEEILREDRDRFSYFINKCTQHLKVNRYQTIDEVIYEFENNIQDIENKLSKEKIEEKIKNCRVDQSVMEYLNSLTAEENVSLILKYSDNFEKILELSEINIAYKIVSETLEFLKMQYNGLCFNDYTTIAKIMYNLFHQIEDEVLKRKIKEIVRYCAEDVNRYDCKPLYEKIK